MHRHACILISMHTPHTKVNKWNKEKNTGDPDKIIVNTFPHIVYICVFAEINTVYIFNFVVVILHALLLLPMLGMEPEPHASKTSNLPTELDPSSYYSILCTKIKSHCKCLLVLWYLLLYNIISSLMVGCIYTVFQKFVYNVSGFCVLIVLIIL